MVKEVPYKSKTGEVYVKKVLEAGDVLTFKSIKIMKNKNNNKYGILETEEEGNIFLTGGQVQLFERLEIKQGDKIEAYEYENQFGKFVGLRIKYEDKPKTNEEKSKEQERLKELNSVEIPFVNYDYAEVITAPIIMSGSFEKWRELLLSIEDGTKRLQTAYRMVKIFVANLVKETNSKESAMGIGAEIIKLLNKNKEQDGEQEQQ